MTARHSSAVSSPSATHRRALLTVKEDLFRGWPVSPAARVALFDRTINNAERQLAFSEILHRITDREVRSEEVVHASHGILQAKHIKPKQSLDQDLELTDPSMSYGGGVPRRTIVEVRRNRLQSVTPRLAEERTRDSAVINTGEAADRSRRADGWPDFGSMNSAQRLAYDCERLQRKLESQAMAQLHGDS